MRLRRLEFEGVGSFADRMEIDFDVVGAAGMFLVEGPTGSGKSTILDAIVFALYGSVAGSNSDLARLDSHVRDRAHEPYVELDVTCGDATYRVRRVPRHERDKRRGQGTMRDEGSVSLIRLTPDPAALSHKAKEVGDWVIATIGLTKQQFVSTIVLAQGEFAAFLDADTAVRAQILERVFGTQFYTQVEDQLAAMRKTALGRRAQAERDVEEVVQRSLGVLGLQEADDPQAAIAAQQQHLTAQQEQARAAYEQAQDAQAAAAQRLAAARLQAERQRHKRQLQDRERGLRAQKERIGTLRERLLGHDRALPAVAALTAWQEAGEQDRRARAAEAAAQAQLEQTQAGPADPHALTALVDLLGQLRAPADLEARMPALQAEEQQTGEEAAVARQRVLAAAAQQEALTTELADLRAADIDLPAARAEAAQLERQRSSLQARQALLDRIAGDEPGLTAARAHLDDAHARLRDAQEAVQAARSVQVQDQAAALAAGLRDGEPCLVCGATQHPSPASPPAPGGSDVAAAEAAEAAARELWLDAREVHDRLVGRLQELRQGLAGETGDPAEELAQVSVRHADLEARIGEAERRALRREEVAGHCVQVATDIAEVRAAAERAAAQHAAASTALAEAQERVADAAQGFASVAARREVLDTSRAAMAAALDAGQRARAAAATLEQAERVLSQTLSGVGLPDAAAVTAAVMEPADAERLRAEVTAHDEACTEVTGALRELADVDPEAAVDLDGAAAEAAQCETVVKACHERLVTLDHVLGELGPLQDLLAQRVAVRERVTEQTAGVIRMAELATATRGEVMHRVRLSSFVLMRRFEAVVEAANDRLDAISEGRYQLRVRPHGLDNRGQAGLDLAVEDQRTERQRSARSLSGGERFYVSLALALGLADVVRSESGGVQLGTLFIDEGFGSLDATVLEEVMDMLEQVRAGEDRVIGLVSHVDLLKQRIDPRISVRRDPERPGVSTLQVRA